MGQGYVGADISLEIPGALRLRVVPGGVEAVSLTALEGAEGVPVSAEQPEGALQLRAEAQPRDGALFELAMPYHATLRLKCPDAAVQVVDYLEGDLEVDASDIRVHKVRGERVRLCASSGGIEVGRAVEASDLELSAVKGTVQVAKVMASQATIVGKQVQIKAGYVDNARVEALGGRLDVNSFHGVLTAEQSGGGDVGEPSSIRGLNGVVMGSFDSPGTVQVHFDSLFEAKQSVARNASGALDIVLPTNQDIDVDVVEASEVHLPEHASAREDGGQVADGMARRVKLGSTVPKHPPVRSSGKLNMGATGAASNLFGAGESPGEGAQATLLTLAAKGAVRVQVLDWRDRIKVRFLGEDN